MAFSDDFKEALRAGKLAEAFVLAISKAVELNITTWVASPKDDLNQSVTVGQAQPGKRLRTRINLVQGKIENEIGDQFIGSGSYKELQQFHLEQVKAGNQTIKNNLESLQKMFRLMAEIQQQKLGGDHRQIELLDIESQPLLSDEVATSGLEIEPQELAVETSFFPTITETQPNVQAVVPPIEQLPDTESSNLETPTTEMPISEEEVEDSKRVGLDASEDYGILTLEDLEPDSETIDLEEGKDLGVTSQTIDLAEESEPGGETVNSLKLEEGEELGFVFPTQPPTKASDEDEDWEDLLDEASAVNSTASANMEEEEDWGEWLIEDSESESAIPNLESLDLEDDEDWEEFEEFESAPSPFADSSDLNS
ncbi:MAG: hypothetical protein AB4426_34585 [Xenococcaceae cyanobacterium]